MCRCKYPKIISKKNINLVEDELGDRCYKTSFTLDSDGKNVLIISRAPKGIESDSCYLPMPRHSHYSGRYS